MKTKDIVKYTLIGVVTAIVIFLILIFGRPLLHKGETTATLIKDPVNWLSSTFAGVLNGYVQWEQNRHC